MQSLSATTTLEVGAAYVRVSTDDQTELSPDAQVRVIMEAAKNDGFVIPREYVFIEKKGISGRKANNRPEFQHMIAVAKSQKPAPFKRLYVWKFSRFARNQDESTFYKSILRKKCGIEIKSVSEPIMDGMFGRLIECIIEWSDEYYSINLSGEVIRGMTEKAMRDGYQTTPCLGYSAVGGGKPFVINESSYPIVEYIFQSYHDGHDILAIAREVNLRGFRTRRGNAFDNRAISRILSNRFYIGEVQWNDINFAGSHETRESVSSIFDDVQQRLASEYRPLKRREVSANAHWLSGLLKCSVCGASLGFNRSNNRKNHSDFFQCWKYAKGFHSGSCSISVKNAENAVLASLREVLSSGNVEYEYIRKINETSRSEEIMIQEALTRLEVKERRIKEAYENEVDTLEEYKQNKQRLNNERAELQQNMGQICRQKQQEESNAPGKEEIMRRISSVYDLIADPRVNYESKGNALRSVVKKIVFDRNQNRFYFYYYVS